MTTKTSRRAILAGAAALPALSLPAIATPAHVDPIFAAIESHRKIEAAFCASGNETENCSDELCSKSSAALGELVAMTPTTVAGCAALLRYLEAHEETYDDHILLDSHSDNVSVPARDLLSRIATALEAAVQS